MKRYEYRIADVCESIHMGLNGSGEPMTDADLARWVAVLEERLATWHEPTSEYDRCYRSLIAVTLQDARFAGAT